MSREPSFLSPPNFQKKLAFFFVVILPTLISIVYYGFVASDRYISEARFSLRTLGGMNGNSNGASPAAIISDTLGIVDYLKSLDAMQAVDREVDLRKVYAPASADYFSRIGSTVSQEKLLEYYRSMVEVTVDQLSGIVTVKVQAFSAGEAQKISALLIRSSELLVNRFSQRAAEDMRKLVADELALSEKQLTDVRLALTRYREEQKTLDTSESTVTVMDIVGGLRGELARIEAEMRAVAAFLRPDNPRMYALRTRGAALRDQIDRELQRVGGDQDRLAQIVGEFERLQITREFAEKRHGLALEAYDLARAESQRQHAYLVTIVQPQVAQDALYPRRIWIITTIFVGALMVYAIGTLLVAGVKDHFI